MTVRLSTGLANAALDSGIGPAFDGGSGRINVYTGAQPADADDAATGTLLATLTLASDSFGAASGGTITAGSITADAAADNSGHPGYCRVYRTGDTAPGSAASASDRRIDLLAGVRTTLSAGIDNAVATIPLTSTEGFPTSGAVIIDSERITYSGVSGNDLTGATRGAGGTSAASHSSGAAVLEADVEVRFDNANFVSDGFVAGAQVSMSSWTITQPRT